MELAPILGLIVGDDKKKLESFFVIGAHRDCDPGMSVSNTKGKRELKNLECSINFGTRGCGSSRVKDKMSYFALYFWVLFWVSVWLWLFLGCLSWVFSGCVFGLLVGLPRYIFLCTWRCFVLF